MNSGTLPRPSPDLAAPRCVSHPFGQPLQVQRDGDRLVVTDPRPARAGDAPRDRIGRWQWRHGGTDADQDPELRWLGPCSGEPSAAHLLAIVEAAFTFEPRTARLLLQPPFASALNLVEHGLALPAAGGRWIVHREMFFQHAPMWLPQVASPIPLRYALTGDRRHPLRAAKRSGVLYQRHIPWLDCTFSFRSLDIDTDLPRFHRWMNEPDVAQVWQEDGDLAKHRGYLDAIAADPHMQSMIACLDGEPFGYFEAYWAKENRIAPFCEADDHDRGWHVLIGEPAFRGKAFATAWLTSISHYLFLADPRTRRIVGEPRADHRQQLRNLDRSGYAKVKEFDFPHKRAMLVTLLRERFFTDTLWWPREDEPATPTALQART